MMIIILEARERKTIMNSNQSFDFLREAVGAKHN